ncbi:MAG TPA: phosphodiester glycosidase family protein [Ignavibacteriales bacterium]|nr:phosphodiester glycosidase family protein [Ignavibacteriales bacterium]
MKNLLCFLIILTNILLSQNYDTLQNKKLVNGIQYTKLKSKTGKLIINVLKVNLDQPNIKIVTAKGNDMVHQFNDVPNGGWKGTIPEEQLTILGLRKSIPEENKYVYAAINGDFGSMGRPNNIQIIDGVILQYPKTNAVITFDDKNNVVIERVTLDCKLKAKVRDTIVPIHSINEGFRQADKLIMYNRYIGSDIEEDSIYSGQNQWGWESALKPLVNWKINDTIPCLVMKERKVGVTTKTKVPKDWIILSEHNTFDKWTLNEKMEVGDQVKVYTKVNSSLQNPVQMIGGSPQIIKNGVIQIEQGYADEGITFDPNKPKPYLNKSARTIIGYAQDKKTLFMVVVDSNANSDGMNLQEVSEFMVNSLGVYDALNLAGGEKSSMAAMLDENLGLQMVDEQPKGEPNVVNAILIYNIPQATGINNLGDKISKNFVVEQNYPNPFNPTTTIKINIPEDGYLKVDIYNILGSKVMNIYDNFVNSGYKSLSVKMNNLPTGTYYYKVEYKTNGGLINSQVKKMILIK